HGNQVWLLAAADGGTPRRENGDSVVARIAEVAAFVERAHAKDVVADAAVVKRLGCRTVVAGRLRTKAAVFGERGVLCARIGVVIDCDVRDTVAIAENLRGVRRAWHAARGKAEFPRKDVEVSGQRGTVRISVKDAV